MNALFIKSLAETGKLYVACQARIRGSDTLHVQIPAADFTGGNRSYGHAFNVTVPSAAKANVQAAFAKVDAKSSLAGTHKAYLPMQVTTIGYDGRLHFQAQDGKLNRDYGLAFTVSADADDVAAVNALLAMFKKPAPVTAKAAVQAAIEPAPKAAPVKLGELTLDPTSYTKVVLSNANADIVVKDAEATIEFEGDVTIVINLKDGSVRYSTIGDTLVSLSEKEISVALGDGSTYVTKL